MVLTPFGLSLGAVQQRPRVTDKTCSVSFVAALVSAATRLSDTIRGQGVPSSDLENQLENVIKQLKECLLNPVPMREEEVDFFRRQLDAVVRSDGWGDKELREQALKLLSGIGQRGQPPKSNWDKVLAWLKENWMLVAAGLVLITLVTRRRR